jgi:hypothetical protein
MPPIVEGYDDAPAPRFYEHLDFGPVIDILNKIPRADRLVSHERRAVEFIDGAWVQTWALIIERDGARR